MIIIDGVRFDIPIVSLKRTAEFLDKYAKRTEDGNLQRKLIGVYFNYQLKLARSTNVSKTVYQNLWNKLTEPVEFHMVTVPDESGTYTFTAYFAGVADEMLAQQGSNNYWKNLTVNFTAKSPARKPS
ncbi:MAG: hypothetical protein E7L17_12990 [Clostridium sp.]|uniref:hypothetical protein n=1 Tax=Clostridium sp. TaxID=1506 RepID=UPI002914B29E|nr:hypothetical protein [Clostridium sp.]MDU7339017.1 hypothetical protein [Clostridium sp.]